MPSLSEIIDTQKKHLKEQLAILEKADVSKLEAQKAEHVRAIEEIDAQIQAIKASLGIEEKPSKIKVVKPPRQGKLVSLDALKRYILHPENPAWVESGVLSIRKAGIDTACVKKLVEDNPTVLTYTLGTWPKVSLKK